MIDRIRMLLIDIFLSVLLIASLFTFIASTNQFYAWMKSPRLVEMSSKIEGFFWRDHEFHWYTDPE